ncbi:MAG TPA: hypothetical protein VFY05_03095, partial [Candidatus Angelobacter sp.]|nr:hypothetical protein [Candidatus Angelobacter sp.]
MKKLIAGAAMTALSLVPLSAIAQQPPKLKSQVPQQRPAAPAKLTPQQKFVLDTVNMAVALPEPDPQDHLRVLASAADVVSTVDRNEAKKLWHEGVRIESELIRVGEKPAVSLMSSGQADCQAALSFVENLPDNAAFQAEQSLIGAVTSCPKQTLDAVSRKLDAALDKGIVPSRALMATIDAQGSRSQWSQVHFEKMFSSLPDPHDYAGEAQNFAAMYSQMAPNLDQDLAGRAGLQLLDWLGKLQDSALRTMAIHITADAMQQALGEKDYEAALQKDLVANSVVQNPGENREIERPEEATVSVLEAMDKVGTDQTESLRGLPPVERAREAAASGFAAGTSGHKAQAAKYFDMAFDAVNEAWDARTPKTDASALVQEVGEAAAQVNSVNALTRAQALRDPSAQAIAMLAVARVVA